MGKKEKYGWATIVAFVLFFFQAGRVGFLSDLRGSHYASTWEWLSSVGLLGVTLYFLVKWGDSKE